MVLVDTSVWVEVFRKGSRFRLDAAVDLDEVATCLPVIQELLQGFREESAFRVAKEAILAFPVVESPLRVEIFEGAVDLYRTARRAGLTIRSGVDCLIAVCALRNDLAVLHHDRDFDSLARVSQLSVREIRVR